MGHGCPKAGNVSGGHQCSAFRVDCSAASWCRSAISQAPHSRQTWGRCLLPPSMNNYIGLETLEANQIFAALVRENVRSHRLA
jgi:hypothetical protein